MESKGRGASGLNQPMGKATRFGILESKTKMLITLQPGTAGDALLLFRQRSDQEKVVTKVNFHVNFTRVT